MNTNLKKKKIFILGSTGMLGHVLCKYLLDLGNYDIYCFGRRKLSFFLPNILNKIKEFDFDLEHHPISLLEMNLKTIQPDFIINCIGLVKQRVNSSIIDDSVLINSFFVKNLEKLINKNNLDTKLIHLSTDCVFSGKKGGYQESDIVDPVDIYGMSKSMGEIEYSKNVVTLRTSIIGFELDRKIGLLEWFFNNENNKINGFNKFIFSGLTTFELSKVIEKTILQNFIPGLFHISSFPITKYELLKKINSIFELNKKIIPKGTPICDRSLDSQKFKKIYPIKINSWDTMINDLKTQKFL